MNYREAVHLIMCIGLLISLALFSPALADVEQTASSSIQQCQETGNSLSLPVIFTENQGQWPDNIKFRANASGMSLLFTPDAVFFHFSRYTDNSSSSLNRTDFEAEQLVLKMVCSGAVAVEPKGESLLNGKSNFFLGNDRKNWRSGVRNYKSVVYENIYPGIDLKFYINNSQIEFDFIVHPGANPSLIRLSWDGINSLGLNRNGGLEAATAWGVLTEEPPIIYQTEDGKTRMIDGSYRLFKEFEYGFTLTDSYNPEKPLIIDPKLAYSTYLGGSLDDWGFDIAVDPTAGNIVYITGQTSSIDFHSLVTPYQPALTGGFDSFIAKLNLNNPGVGSLEYATYLGGTGDEHARGIAVDHSGNAYITGWTMSGDYPVASVIIPFQNTYAGNGDVFLSKVDNTGSTLLYSTYIGGTSGEIGWSVVVDMSENAYITGWTQSSDFPINSIITPYQPTFAGGEKDIFITKIHTPSIFIAGFIYSSFLGGTNEDQGWGISLGIDGTPSITGLTNSTNFPTLFPLQAANAGQVDAILARFDVTLNGTASLLASTYLGGSGDDIGTDIAPHHSLPGDVYLTGNTNSSNFPTLNPYQGTYGGHQDGFMAKVDLDPPLSMIYSTYMGGSDREDIQSIAADIFEYAYITGYTLSFDYPECGHFYPKVTNQRTAVATKLNRIGDDLIYSTYLIEYGGNNADDFGMGIAVDVTSMSAYVTGYIQSTNFPTKDPYQSSSAGGREAFVTWLEHCCVGLTGNLNCSPSEEPDISDIVAFIDYLYITKTAPCCPDEADVNSDCVYDITDIVRLIDYLYISHDPLAPCRQ